MKLTTKLTKWAGLMLLAAPGFALAANPASQDWVMQQLAIAVNNAQAKLTATEWNAVCTSGSPNSATGCFGNASSAAFAKLSMGVGGFTEYAGINPANVPNSVFIKAFFAGTNIPTQPNSGSNRYLKVTVTPGAVRCNLFTQAGLGINTISGIANNMPANGSVNGFATSGPQSAGMIAINNTTSTSDLLDNSNYPNAINVPNPVYLLCVGYNTTDGSTAASLAGITAV